MATRFDRLNGKDFGHFVEMANLEMATNFGIGREKKTKETADAVMNYGSGGESDGAVEELLDEVRHLAWEHVRSSSRVEYDNQEAAWAKVAKAAGFANAAELAKFVANCFARSIGGGWEPFPGIEGLAALAHDRRITQLMKYTDYATQDDFHGSDQLIMSFSYGGKRQQQWMKYAGDAMRPRLIAQQIKASADGNGLLFGAEADLIEPDVVRVRFTADEEWSDEDKKMLKGVFDNSDGVFDFDIDEDEDSDVWTIRVRRK